MGTPLDNIVSFKINGQPSGIGPEIAKSIHTFLHSHEGQLVIDELRNAGVKLDADASDTRKVSAGPLSGKTFVVTGTLEKYTRDQIETLIELHGGHPTSSVSKSTDFLIAGEKAGSKLDKANKLGVRVISEAEFDDLIAS